MCPSRGEWIETMCSMHTLEYCVAMKKETLLPATPQMELEDSEPVTKGRTLYDGTHVRYGKTEREKAKLSNTRHLKGNTTTGALRIKTTQGVRSP